MSTTLLFQRDEEKWLRLWTHESREVEDEQTTIIATAEVKTERTLQLLRYSSLNEIEMLLFYCISFKAKLKGPLQAEKFQQANC